MAEYERLRVVIDRVQATINGLRTQRASLGIGGSTPDDEAKLRAIRARLHAYSARLPGLAAAGVIPAEMRDIVKRDLDEMLSIFETSVDWPLEPGPAEPAPKLPRSFIVKPHAEPAQAEEEDEAYSEVTRHVKGHDDEVRRILRALRLRDHVLILGPDGEGKTETLLRLQASLGGVYLQCSEETTARELAAGYNPGAPPAGALYTGALARLEDAAAPTLYLDNATRLSPAAQALLTEAMSGAYTSPLDGSRRALPPGFTVVAAGTLDTHVQEAPDPSLLGSFGKVVEWGATPLEAVQALLARYALPRHAFDLAVWARAEASRMRYLAPVSVRALIGFAREYHAYRDVYQDETRLRQLAVDRLLRVRVLNRFGLEELEEARGRAMEYAWGAP
jgi:MoxR-like ATPase